MSCDYIFTIQVMFEGEGHSTVHISLYSCGLVVSQARCDEVVRAI